MLTVPSAEILNNTNRLPCAAAPDAWFPGKGHQAGQRALDGCTRCPIRAAACARHALNCEQQGPPIVGVWAGIRVPAYSGLGAIGRRNAALAALELIAADGDITSAPTAQPEKAAS